jgi:hypothetical protein
MSTPFTYRDLDAWKFGMNLVEECYRVTARGETRFDAPTWEGVSLHSWCAEFRN